MHGLDPLIVSDFRNMTWWLWGELGLPEPTRVQVDIATYLQRGPRRRMVQAFRGVGKSWITAAYVIWRLLKNPNERILVVSASKDRADAFSVFVKRLIHEIPELSFLAPREGQRDSNLAFDVGPSEPHQAPSVRSVGINGQLTGGRATIIIADDVEVPKNSMTQAMRDKLSESIKEFDAVLTPGGEVVYLGTPQNEMSIYSDLPTRGYDVRIWPARFPAGKLRERYGDKLAPLLRKDLDKDQTLVSACNGRGAPTDPKRFDDKDLLEREASYGRSGFSLQFMLDTSVSDSNRYPLKLADLVVMAIDKQVAPVKIAWGSAPEQIINHIPSVGLAGDRLHRPMYVSPEFAPYQGVVMAIDPAGRGGDELGYAIVAMLNGYLFILACSGLKGGYTDENLQKLADLAKEHSVRQVIIEENFGDGMFSKLLAPFLTRTYPVSMEEVKHSIQKEKRIIDTLEPVMNQHRLVVSEKLLLSDQRIGDDSDESAETAKKFQLFFQMTRLTKDRGALAKDDRIDVLSIAVNYWVEIMDKDNQQAEEEHRSSLLDIELAKFHEQVLGRSPTQTTWTRSLR